MRPNTQFLEEEVRLLVQHFGVDEVWAALSKASNGRVAMPERLFRPASSRAIQPAIPTVASILERLRGVDETKHRLLTDFHSQLKDKKVLPESQDIRQFAHWVGLKEISGRSRKDLIPPLMRFLAEQPTERLPANLARAATVSEQHRQQGFSVLTDKLLGGAGRTA